MVFEWTILSYVTAAEVIMIFLLTMPGPDFLRKGMTMVTRNLIKPLLLIIPFCLYLRMDIYWKYETRTSCNAGSCILSEFLRYQKSILISQRDELLILLAPFLYWILYNVLNLVVKVEKLNKRVERLKRNIKF
ncbi:hypothetical protein ISN45_Aa04g024490 [Arabidopsis thaliana x Arabidopsis arenosa]|uniref:Endoplasmic reticulum transmembrane protein n=1 Tax=Arabidopsis thaliana x Arabidopsis arenosa TaxID=1240361 RepID=A0A8T2ACK2_9BRAS|nr:hypothetical protein ISN45_Aa04g024490 [Arabidopsis thaliana x Arabidopsis arenosa]